MLHMHHDHRGHRRVAALLTATGPGHTVDGVGRASMLPIAAATLPREARALAADLASQRAVMLTAGPMESASFLPRLCWVRDSS
jgi:hypothetical protein